jgi:hypothetical protein
MQVGDIVECTGRLAVIIKMSDPSPMFPDRVATLLLYDGTYEEKVISLLKEVKN